MTDQKSKSYSVWEKCEVQSETGARCRLKKGHYGKHKSFVPYSWGCDIEDCLHCK